MTEEAPAQRGEAEGEIAVDWFDGERTRLATLHALADDSSAAVESYRDRGRILTAQENGEIVGLLQLVDHGPGEVEIKSLAILEGRQRQGIGRLLVERALRESRELGSATMLVATATADTGVLRFYQRVGFRMLRIERDAFTPENGYDPVDVDGIPLRDRVWLSAELQANA